MKQHTYVLACPVRETSPLGVTLASLQVLLTRVGIACSRPRIGYHVTCATPFLQTDDMIRSVALGIEFASGEYDKSKWASGALNKGLDFFVGEASDALVLRLEASREIRDLVERLRSKLGETTDWVYPPESYHVNFHATIGEAHNLQKQIRERDYLARLSERAMATSQFDLEIPAIYKKASSSWQLVKP